MSDRLLSGYIVSKGAVNERLKLISRSLLLRFVPFRLKPLVNWSISAHKKPTKLIQNLEPSYNLAWMRLAVFVASERPLEKKLILTRLSFLRERSLFIWIQSRHNSFKQKLCYCVGSRIAIQVDAALIPWKPDHKTLLGIPTPDSKDFFLRP